MVKYYCDCLNVCAEYQEDSDQLDEFNLSDEEKQNDFFQLLPLIIVQNCIISEQHTALVHFDVVGSWMVHKCAHCSVYTHAMKCDESTTVRFINGSLKMFTDEESEQKKKSSEFSPVFQILVADLMYHPMDYNGTSHLSSEISNSIIELKELVAEKIEERRERTNKIIEQFISEQENALKNFIKRANNDFQSIKTAVLSNCPSDEDEEDTDIKMSEKNTQETNFSNSVINDFDLLTNSVGADEQIKDKNRPNLLEYQTSLDYEGLFLLDGVEKNDNDVVNEDEDHSEEDPSDTDDSNSRDEGIHIPRVKNVAIARSLPIRVRTDFDPLRIFDEDDDDKRKPNYKRKTRYERPVDIAASMKALANSVYGDTIFGDLPPPRIGSRI